MSRLRNEDGFTLMEVIVAMTVGLVLLGSTLTLLEGTVRLNTGVLAKTDAMQRGRQAMDIITQQLRSQVCFDINTSAIVLGSDENSVTFYSDFTEDAQPAIKRTIRITTRGILSERFNPPVPKPNPFTPASYPGSPTSSNLLLENARLQIDPITKQAIPFLKYYAYRQVGDVLKADLELSPPLDASEAARAARVEISYASLPTGSTDTKKAVGLFDEVVARHSDPNLAVPDPKCV